MKIVFICTGNTCRSPMAEGYLKSLKIPNLDVLSRGLFANGSSVSEKSVNVMSEIGIDIKDHISKPLCDNDTDADLFVCMSATHEAYLEAAGIKRDKITVLGGGIPDPFGLEENEYRFCRDKIIWSINELIFNGKIFPFKIVSALKSDAPKIAELERVTFSEAWSEKAITDSMDAATLFFCAKENDNLLGYIGVSIIADEGYITNVAVFPEYRGKGIATLLLNKVIAEAKLRNASFVSLEVRSSNERAQKIYGRLGFKKEGQRKNFYNNPTEDAIIMTRRF